MAHIDFSELVTGTRMLNDIRKMSPGHQTSNVESYHNVVNKFAPKSTHFEYPSMIIR